jgi:hypothetical protein
LYYFKDLYFEIGYKNTYLLRIASYFLWPVQNGSASSISMAFSFGLSLFEKEAYNC